MKKKTKKKYLREFLNNISKMIRLHINVLSTLHNSVALAMVKITCFFVFILVIATLPM